MSFYADLHVHSRFSRATGRDCTLEQLSYWAQRKGLLVVGTGDFTHPGWRREMSEKLTAAEPGLYRLKADLEKGIQGRLPPSCRLPTRFVISGEISSIYKKGGQTRKVHHLVLMPDFESAEKFAARLSRIGNIESDGRPILGIDSRDLLEMVLEAGEGAFLIPAHIWTPWFSVLGAASGFDSIAECYGDLTCHVFALETGLSSDPPMNWRVSALDRFRLVSNSDAHSPAKLGREACVFDTTLNFYEMRRALATGSDYGGTIEFFPEEGKYHFDGHRRCGVRLAPGETRSRGGLCPVCGKPVTVGVMHRVETLADRPEGMQPENAVPFHCLIPLDEVLGEVLGVGCEARAVASVRDALVTRLGPELSILQTVPLDQIARTGSSLLAEAIGRMREGKVLREPGYDGEYGSIRLFSKDELSSKEDMPILFELARSSNHEVGTKVPEVRSLESPARTRSGASDPFSSDTSLVQTSTVQGEISASEREAEPREVRNANILSGLDPDQRMAAEHVYGPLLIIAGPGTGKTRTLTHRIAHVLAGYDVSPEHCVAITFTRRAAEEMRERLEKLVPEEAKHITITTFHGLGYRILREFGQVIGLRTDFRVIGDRQQRELVSLCLGVPLASAAYLSRQFSDYRRAGLCRSSDSGLADRIERYTSQKKKLGVVDFDDLIVLPLTILRNNPDVVAKCRERYRWISVDEFQDVDALQYELLRQLVPPEGNICVIGDPDQAIYGFRGTDPRFFAEFLKDFPGATRVVLSRNYRSTGSIVSASMQIISASPSSRSREVKATLDAGVRIVLHEAPTDRAEAEFVVHAIERLLGGSSFFSVDSARVAETGKKSLAFSDFAVLYRTEEQVATLCEALSRSGMPFQKRSHIFLAESPLVIAFVQHLLELPDNMPLSQQLNDAETRLFSDGARKTENDEALLSRLRLLAHSSQDRTEFLSQLEMGQDADLFDPYADRIALLTLHASKGLEFDTVFIVGCEEGVLPIFAGDGAEVEEERRLLFVGMTRARRRLVLSWAKKRMWRGAVREMRPSRFLTDIDKVLLDSSGMVWTGRGRKRPRQLDLF